MQEYWVNVYETSLTKTQYMGNPRSARCNGVIIGGHKIKPIYRIHVKMKYKPIDWSLQPTHIYERYMYGGGK